MAELVDALDLGSSGVTRGSSTLPSRTKVIRLNRDVIDALSDVTIQAVDVGDSIC